MDGETRALDREAWRGIAEAAMGLNGPDKPPPPKKKTI